MTDTAVPTSTELAETVSAPTAALAEFAADLRYEQLPEAVLAQLKRCVLDTLGCGLFGSTLPWGQLVTGLVADAGSREVATLWGTTVRSSPADAALANGTYAHAFEYDEGHTASFFHPGSATLPAVLGIAEQRGDVNGRQALTALAAGYEVGIRIGMALGYGSSWRGFHQQGIVGTFCAAGGAGQLLGLEPDRMLHALGTAGSQGGGLMSAQFGAMVKRFHAGRAAQAGVYGAILASRGFTGTMNILEAQTGGFLQTMSETPNPAILLDGLGQRWETEKVGFKVYPAVGASHTSIWALGELMRKNSLQPQDIAKVLVRGNKHLVMHAFWEYEPNGVTAAQINLPYLLTVLIHEGEVFVDQFSDDRINNSDYVAYSRRVTAVIDPVLDKNPPHLRNHVIVEVTLADGRVLTAEVPVRHGSEADPLSDAEVAEKFRRLASRVLPDSAVDEIVEAVNGLERMDNLAELGALLASRPTR
jgi:2-methylcitrate dehydratase PrpD